jgi:hypothetical protein
MPTPHKHAAVIKAWADGHQVQYKELGGWVDLKNDGLHGWYEHGQYRIKPSTIKYRNFLWAPSGGASCRRVVCVVTPEDQLHEPRETWGGFIRWIGDWQEVEV